MHTGKPSSGGLFETDDTLAVIVELVLRTAWMLLRAAWRVVWFLLRAPVLAVLVVGGVVLDARAGHTITLAALLGLVVALVVWGLVWPGSYRAHLGPRVAVAWRMPVYRLHWPVVASRTGLVSYAHDRGGRSDRATPSLRKLTVTPAGIERLWLRLPVGLTPDDVAHRLDGIAHGFGAREARLVPVTPGWAVVELHRRDALAKTIRPLPAEETVRLAGVPVGRCEDGTLWRFRLLGTHVLVAGATGSGKGSVVWSLLHGLAPAITAGWVQVWAVDPKGGMELRPGQGLFSRFEDATPETMCDLLEDLVAVMDTRAQALAAEGVRKHRARPGSPHVLAVIDELATLTAFADRATTRRIDQALGLLLTKGRAVGITVLAAVQDPGKDVVGWRDLFPTRIALRLDNPLQVDMVLGDGARDTGARADHISETTPGVAYVRVEGTRTIRRVRAAYLTDDDVTALAAAVTASPALTVPRPVTMPAEATVETGPSTSRPRSPRKPRTPRHPVVDEA